MDIIDEKPEYQKPELMELCDITETSANCGLGSGVTVSCIPGLGAITCYEGNAV